jgi:hypothetical protein
MGPAAGPPGRAHSRVATPLSRAADRYPQLARVTAAPALELDVDALFEFGLERLFDGYAVLIDHRV